MLNINNMASFHLKKVVMGFIAKRSDGYNLSIALVGKLLDRYIRLPPYWQLQSILAVCLGVGYSKNHSTLLNNVCI